VKTVRIQGPRRFRGELTPPGDKSITHRALMLGAIARGETLIDRPLAGLDCRATAAAVEALGAKVKRGPKSWRVAGVGPGPLVEPPGLLDCGNSGTSIRLLAGLVAGFPIAAILDGDASIRKRPMGRVLAPLAAMGATVLGREKDTKAPFAIRGGKLTGRPHTLPIASAQVKSAILLAGLHADGITVVTEPAQSRDHSERMLLHFGAALTSRPGTVSIKGGTQLDAREVYVPADLSSAAFFLVGACGAKGSSLACKDVGTNPTRAGILDALERMGAKISREGERDASGEPLATLVAKVAPSLTAIDVGAAAIPAMIDEVPIFALAAARATGTTRITGASELSVKESDRLATTAALLAAFGAKAERLPDGLVIEGPSDFRAAKVASGGDHRIAMTAAIAACWAKGESVIDDVACVETSYPGFFEDLARVTEPV
jgi:3-phosphoshikimate 1-carboxyvinyltransferase